MKSDTYWLNEDSRTFLSRGYLPDGVSAEARIEAIAKTAEGYLEQPGFANKFQEGMYAGWASLASPVWANFGTERGLPISCNGSHFSDTIADILLKTAEIGMMTKQGAGTSAYLGEMRHRGAVVKAGGVSSGPIHFAELIQSTTGVISQSSVRRGHCAIYLPVDHPDIEEFLSCREEGHPIQHLSLGVCIPDAWMEAMIAGDRDKRRIMTRIIRKRFETGYPYLFFTDNANRGAPACYREQGYRINASQMCTEIMLPATREESFVCDLSSLNAEHYDAWKQTDFVETMTMFLDAVMEEYIRKTANMPLMEAPHRFARRHRALGLGTLGWHSCLQARMVPFESEEASRLNVEIHKLMDERSLAASQEMAERYGEPEVCQGYGMRNTTRLAIAPTTSSSFILGQVSPSIEPLDSNYFVKDLQKGRFTYRNPYLQSLLAEKGIDTDATWDSILLRGGSVQHLEGLSDHEKAVFKTFDEIDQAVVVSQAVDRQPFIDQGQSLNIKIHPETPIKDVNALIVDAWERGLKSLYYQRSTNLAQEYVRELISCKSCEA